MATALIVLAIGSVLAGYIGIPHALGGHNALGGWLAPAFAANNCGAPVTTGALAGIAMENCAPGTDAALASMTATASQVPDAVPAIAQPEPAAIGVQNEVVEEHADETMLERVLMGSSSLIAFFGIFLARYLWIQNPGIPTRLAARFSGVYNLLLNKYYVDEIYDAALVQPIKGVSTIGLWKGVDVKLVDGAVNAAGQIIGGLAAVLRLLQSGSVKSYAAGTLVGVVAILAFYLWR